MINGKQLAYIKVADTRVESIKISGIEYYKLTIKGVPFFTIKDSDLITRKTYYSEEEIKDTIIRNRFNNK